MEGRRGKILEKICWGGSKTLILVWGLCYGEILMGRGCQRILREMKNCVIAVRKMFFEELL